MFAYRPFRNIDPPAIVAIWNAQPLERALAAPMSIELLERMVLSKPYFDRQGLIVAVEQNGRQERPVAFAHAGFEFTEDGQSLSRDSGAIYLVLSLGHPAMTEVRLELVRRCEDYLRSRGVRRLYGGGSGRRDVFYLGLYGGAEAPGVLLSDPAAVNLYRQAGYQERPASVVLQKRLSGFRPPVDRRQMQIRRSHTIEAVLDAPAETWRQACTLGPMERTVFLLMERGAKQAVGRAVFWDMAPLAASWGVSAMGLSELEITPEKQRQGLGMFLLGEAMRQLGTHGVSLVEAHAPLEHPAALGLFTRLGFEEVDRSVEFSKPA